MAWGTASAQPVTVGFWVRSNITGTLTVTLRNSAATRSYPVNVTINATSTWEWKTVTVPGCTDGVWQVTTNTGCAILFCVGAGSTFHGTNATWNSANVFATSSTTNFMATQNNLVQITGLIMVPGSEAPSSARSALIMRPFDQELLMCQRYWQKSYPYGTLPGANVGAGSNTIFRYVSTDLVLADAWFFSTRLRTSATVTLYDNAGNPGKISYYNGSWQNNHTAAPNASYDMNFYTNVSLPGSTTYVNFDWVANARL
jgi:hypothetical protein